MIFTLFTLSMQPLSCTLLVVFYTLSIINFIYNTNHINEMMCLFYFSIVSYHIYFIPFVIQYNYKSDGYSI